MLSSTGVLGRIARFPLQFFPADMIVPVLYGPLRGSKWIVGSAHHSFWLGSYESGKLRRIARELNPGSIFYDIGANVGIYSLLASRIVNHGRTYAFEPAPKNIWYLQRHLELNHIQNVEVLELALSDRTGTAFFDVGENRFMGHLAEEGSLCVHAVALDALLSEGKICPPNVIKMDIEGAELMALRGASRTFERFRPVLFLATHGREVETECRCLLESWGYDCRNIGSESGSDRAEIIAKFRVSRE